MKKLNKGFTLLELMVTLTIAALLMGVGIPFLSDTIERSRVDSAQKDLARDIAYSRQQALSRNTLISVCRSADGASCAGAGDWNQGWIVFVDTPGGTDGTVDAGEEVLRVHGALASADDLEGSEAFVQFAPTGSLEKPDAGTVLFEVCSPANNEVRGLLVLRSGRALSSRMTSAGVYYVQLDNSSNPIALVCT